MATPSVAERLRGSGLRVTAPRVAVLDVLATARDHPDVDEVRRRAMVSLGTVSTQAVYDVLEALSRVGLARRIEPAGGPARYEARVGDNHHHMVCRRCSQVFDIDCALGAAPCLEPSGRAPDLPAGFVVDEAEVVFWGRCPTCLASPSGSPPSRATAERSTT